MWKRKTEERPSLRPAILEGQTDIKAHPDSAHTHTTVTFFFRSKPLS